MGVCPPGSINPTGELLSHAARPLRGHTLSGAAQQLQLLITWYRSPSWWARDACPAPSLAQVAVNSCVRG